MNWTDATLNLPKLSPVPNIPNKYDSILLEVQLDDGTTELAKYVKDILQDRTTKERWFCPRLQKSLPNVTHYRFLDISTEPPTEEFTQIDQVQLPDGIYKLGILNDSKVYAIAFQSNEGYQIYKLFDTLKDAVENYKEIKSYQE